MAPIGVDEDPFLELPDDDEGVGLEVADALCGRESNAALSTSSAIMLPLLLYVCGGGPKMTVA